MASLKQPEFWIVHDSTPLSVACASDVLAVLRAANTERISTLAVAVYCHFLPSNRDRDAPAAPIAKAR